MQSRISMCSLLLLLTAVQLAKVSGVDVDIKFAEADRSGEEGASLEIIIIIQSPIAAPNSITIRVQSQIASPDATLDPAEESDFRFNDTDITLDSTSGDRLTLPFDLIDDDILENEESFFLSMEFVDEDFKGFGMSRSTTEIIIQADNSDKPTVTLVRGQTDGSTDSDSVFLREDAGNVADAVKLVKTGESEIDISISIIDDRIRANEYDFELQSFLFTIRAAESEVFIPIQIFEDDAVEGDESFGINILSSSPDYYYFGPSLTVTIVDNDPLVIGFVDPLNQTTHEGENTTVCVNFTENIFEGVMVKVTKSGGNATGEHYNLSKELPHTFALSQRFCFTMELVDDDKAEWPRNVVFEVELVDTRANDLWRVSPGREVATVTIEDNDGTPLQPVITRAELLDKVLEIEWDSKEAPLQQTDNFTVTVTIQSDDDTQSPQLVIESVTTNTEDTINVNDPSQNYEVVVCSRNEFGRNCTLPFPVTKISTPTTEPELAPKLQLGIIAIVAAVGAVFLLVCCLLLLLFLCCCCLSDSGQSYYPEKKEKKHAKDFSRYRAYSEDSESSLNFCTDV